MTRLDQEFTLNTPRDIVEKTLIELFSNRLYPIDRCLRAGTAPQNDQQRFNFSVSPYTRGNNILSRSSNFPHGLVYRDDNGTFGVAALFCSHKPVLPNIYIIAPRGKQWSQAVEHFIHDVQEAIPEAEFFVRHLVFDQCLAEVPEINLDIWAEREAAIWI